MTKKMWNIPSDYESIMLPDQILQEFADGLANETKGLLIGQVTETITYDLNDRPKLIYAMHVYVNKLNQSYRLLEVEQIAEKSYPVNLKVVLYTGTEIFKDLKSADELNVKLREVAQDEQVGNLLAHFMNLSKLRDEA